MDPLHVLHLISIQTPFRTRVVRLHLRFVLRHRRCLQLPRAQASKTNTTCSLPATRVCVCVCVPAGLRVLKVILTALKNWMQASS